MAEDTYEVDQIIGRRITSKGKEDYLVRWQSYSPLLSTWEPIDNFNSCQRTIREFFNQHWPVPGTQATSFGHIAEKPNSVKIKQELFTLQALTAKKGKKLLRGLRKDLKEEILRLQVETKSSLENRVESVDQSPLAVSNLLGENQKNMRFRGESTKECSSPETRKIGVKRKIDDVDKTSETPQESPKMSGRKSPRYLNSLKEKHKKPKKTTRATVQASKTRSGQYLTNGVFAPQGTKLANSTSNKKIVLPSKMTRQSLPSCPTTSILEEELVVTKENSCMYIKLCNEAKKNVINLQMCEEIISSLHDAGKDDISVVVITGSGSSFSYGWDLDQFRDLHLADRKHLLQKYRLMTRMLITCPKPLVAAVNGPAAGFGIALAGLCDIVLASNKATFQAKFAEWGHPPIGCCSHTLPSILGPSKAMSMILLNGKLSAVAAQQLGLVSEVLESTDFSEQVVANVQRLLSVSLQLLQDTKSLLHENKVQELANVNEEECDMFLKYITNNTTLNNILKIWQNSLRE